MQFEELTSRAQSTRLRRTALDALQQYPIEVARLRLLNHGFNTTFRVDTTDGRKFALRINVNSQRTPANLAAEVAWLAAIATDTDLWVPTPQPTRTGALTTEVFSPDLGRSLPAALFSWLPGADLGDEATPAQFREVGKAMAVLHQHAAAWQLPKGAELPAIDSVLMGVPYRLGVEHPQLTADARAVLDAAFAQVQQQFDTLLAGARLQPLHGDMHMWNLKWFRGRLIVFDFDDSGMGVPAQDLPISAYYMRDDAAQEAALIEGYQEVRSLPSFTTEQYEAMVASRNLLLLNDLVVTTNAEFKAMLPRYIPNSITKLRAYLDTGVFRHDVPGLIPAP